jgi:signal transduction histidine kinase
LINDVLDISRLEENKMVLEEQPFNIRASVEDSVEVVLMEIEQKDLDIVVDIDPTVPRLVTGDSGRYRQILLNLLSNAVKFSPVGEIMVTVNARDLEENLCEIETSVRDQGIGIPEEAQKYLFQPFIQADSSTTRRYVISKCDFKID